MADVNPSGNALVRYVRESKEELFKVSWPSRATVVRDTLTVLAICAAVGVTLGALDYGLSEGMSKLLARFAQTGL